MNYANFVRGFVVGTGDMSEIAKGWSTYNGDHMSMFNPNSNVPKTLVSHLVRWYANNRADQAAHHRLRDILETPISPELTGKGDLSQSTEDLIGPYDLSDYFMYELLRNGSRPRKIGYLALQAFGDTYEPQIVEKWLYKFLNMYTGSQWKREASPNGTKFGTTALSQRGDHRMAPNTGRNWFLDLATS
jgi:NAD+ synthase (glutamine-hydrolysing)